MKNHGAQLSKTLLKLSPNVTAADRTQCSKRLKISKVTISNYLNGRVTNNDLALQMIELFTELIQARDKKIQQLCLSS